MNRAAYNLARKLKAAAKYLQTTQEQLAQELNQPLWMLKDFCAFRYKTAPENDFLAAVQAWLDSKGKVKRRPVPKPAARYWARRMTAEKDRLARRMVRESALPNL